MPSLRIMTFNVENMLMRYRFREFRDEPLVSLLDVDSEMERANLFRTYWNVLNDENRVFTALTIREGDPDVICLQEVESMRALRAFHDRYLRRLSGHDYTYQVLIDANDARGIDVAVISRYPLVKAVTYQWMEADIQYPDGPRRERVFRRDCLEVHVKKDDEALPVFVCHLKSMNGGRAETFPIRHAEVSAVRDVLTQEFADPADHDWVVVGDFNDWTEIDGVPDTAHALGPLLDGGFSVDLVKRIQEPLDRWTHFYPGDRSYHQLDYVLVSPALAQKNREVVPRIIRNGQPFRAERYRGDRWPRVGFDRPKASDHCPVVVDLEY